MSVELVGDGSTQRLTAEVDGERYTATMPADLSPAGIQPLRVVDLDGDGRDEVMVTELVGANTVGLSVWEFRVDLRQLTLPGGERVRLWEGGGRSVISAYGCETTGGRKQLVEVSGEIGVDTEIYSGERRTYTVANGVAWESSRTSVQGERDAAVWQVDPADCA